MVWNLTKPRVIQRLPAEQDRSSNYNISAISKYNKSARNKRSYTRGRDSNPEVLGPISSSELSKLMSNVVEVST